MPVKGRLASSVTIALAGLVNHCFCPVFCEKETDDLYQNEDGYKHCNQYPGCI